MWTASALAHAPALPRVASTNLFASVLTEDPSIRRVALARVAAEPTPDRIEDLERAILDARFARLAPAEACLALRIFARARTTHAVAPLLRFVRQSEGATSSRLEALRLLKAIGGARAGFGLFGLRARPDLRSSIELVRREPRGTLDPSGDPALPPLGPALRPVTPVPRPSGPGFADAFEGPLDDSTVIGDEGAELVGDTMILRVASAVPNGVDERDDLVATVALPVLGPLDELGEPVELEPTAITPLRRGSPRQSAAARSAPKR